MKPLKASSLYFAIVFAAGFVMGTIRVLFLIPRLGEVFSMLLELPVMIAVSWFSCRFVCGRFAVEGALERALTGFLAFLFLMTAEAGLGAATRPMEAFLSSFVSPAGLLGLAGQILFGLFPLFQKRPHQPAT